MNREFFNFTLLNLLIPSFANVMKILLASLELIPPPSFFELTMAYEDREPFQNNLPKIFVDRYFLVKNIPCHGDTCVIREYVSFFDDAMMVVWIAMDDSAQSNLSDMLFNQVFFVQD